MARPKKSEGGPTAQQSIEQAFWNALEEGPLSSMSVSQLVREASVNRSTFYYYYDDLEDLAQKAVARELPTQLPRLALLLAEGNVNRVVVEPSVIESIERVCLLLRQSGSGRMAQLIEDSLVAMWEREFGLDETADDDARHMLECLAGGVVGVLRRYGRRSDLDSLKACMRAMNRAFTMPSLAFLAQHDGLKNPLNADGVRFST